MLRRRRPTAKFRVAALARFFDRRGLVFFIAQTLLIAFLSRHYARRAALSVMHYSLVRRFSIHFPCLNYNCADVYISHMLLSL